MLNKVSSRHVTSRHVTSRHVTSRHVTSRQVTLNLFWYTNTGPPSVLRTFHGGIYLGTRIQDRHRYCVPIMGEFISVYDDRTPIGTSYLSWGNLETEQETWSVRFP